MSIAIVTGAAGFIGSHLCARLLADGLNVRGLDNFDPYYPRAVKERNLAPLREHPNFAFHAVDLAADELQPLVADADLVFHEAARGGVRTSWGSEFSMYLRANLLATQRLLEALRDSRTRRFVYASSSSVYGEAGGDAVREDAPLQPISPYGVTKLAAERLVKVYHSQHGLPAIMLRYFTVYGPAQRPDMAFHRFIRALLEGRPLEILGTGNQTRDFTYIDDVIEANVQAAAYGRVGDVYNIGGGSPASLREVVRILEQISGRKAEPRILPASAGDPLATCADTLRARSDFGFRPSVSLSAGLARMVAWMAPLVEEMRAQTAAPARERS